MAEANDIMRLCIVSTKHHAENMCWAESANPGSGFRVPQPKEFESVEDDKFVP